ncbi:unnamed protein product [Blepharisma stoltei]|uniref:Uncharacterized protein n=1 Tax=Blepharisma stoltei TaxID=1481888 RepID=A0AAU9J5C7_9CILI|nr:unnamed protein product [Blepharisma stoltei]
MLRRSLRLFSRNWITTTSEDLIPSLTTFFSMNPPPKSTLIVTGPQGTGKSTILQLAFAAGSKSNDPSMFLDVNFAEIVSEPAKEARERNPSEDNTLDPLNFIDCFNQAVVRGLGHLERKKLLPDTAKQELVSLFHNYARKLCALSEEVDKEIAERTDGANLIELRREEKQIGIEIINNKLTSYRNVIKLTEVEYSGYQHIIDNISIVDAFDVVATSILAFRAEHLFGELSSAFLVVVLNTIGKACYEAGIQAPVLNVSQCQVLCIMEKTIKFFEFLLSELVNTKTHFYSVLEGHGIYVSPLSIIEHYSDLFEWCNIKEENEEWFKAYVTNQVPDITNGELHDLWHCIYGNMGLTEVSCRILKSKNMSVSGIVEWVNNVALIDLNRTFKSLETDIETTEEIGLMDKVMSIDRPRVRAACYFLYKLLEEPNYELEVTIKDLVENLVIGRLCVLKILYFNTHTMKIGFDKKVFPSVLPKCDVWKYNETWAERAKNKIAYNKMAQEKLNY